MKLAIKLAKLYSEHIIKMSISTRLRKMTATESIQVDDEELNGKYANIFLFFDLKSYSPVKSSSNDNFD